MNTEPVMLKAMIPGIGVDGGSGRVSSESLLRKKTVRLRIVREAITAREDMDRKILCRDKVSVRLKNDGVERIPNDNCPELLAGEFYFPFQAGARLEDELDDDGEEEATAEERETVAHST
jgi:hypothetical protein